MTNQPSLHDLEESLAMEAHESAAGREPSDETWGIQFNDNPDFVLANDFTGFLWFESREALLDYVERSIPVLGRGDASDEELQPGREAAADAAQKARQSGGTIPPGTSFRLPRSTVTINWMGCFRDLLNGEGAFEAALRSEFRDREEGGSNMPIELQDRSDFLEFVREYGA